MKSVTRGKSRPAPARPDDADHVRTGLGADAIAKALIDNLHCQQAKLPRHATRNDWYMALAYTVRDRMLHRYIATLETIADAHIPIKVVAYLSAEFLTGPHLGNSLINLGIWKATEDALATVGQDLPSLLEQEEEPGLGNGGLGRLAACYMDSLATLNVPAIGYGLRYEFGIFDQAIRDGWQVELTDKWLRFGNPWEIVRTETTFHVNLGGRIEHFRDEQGRHRVNWVPDRVVKGIAYDTPVPGYRAPTTNVLRLWKAEAAESFDFDAFNVGDYYGAVLEKMKSETISKVLYPNDEPDAGKQLRLAQQYFFVSCSLQDMIRLTLVQEKTLAEFDACWAVQLNDTHPSIAIAELMRLFVDVHSMEWDVAWAITQRACGYTNHTLLAEALEKWPVALFAKLLPRHLEIVLEINRRFLDDVRQRHPGDDQLLSRLSLIDESGDKYVRMAHLACVGSHAINGVAALHSELLKQTVLRDFYAVSPDKFFNVTNGVTPRRWMVLSNPKLSALITSRIGDGWVSNLEDELRRLEPFANDSGFLAEWQTVKDDNKRALATFISGRTGTSVDPQSLFDIQVKRLHEYKRQHLNVLYVITLYNRLKRGVRRPRAADGDLRRQIGAGLSHRKADHQIDQLGCRCRQPGPTRLRDAQGRVRSRLQCQEQPLRLPCRRPVGTDFHGGQRSVGNRQYEVRVERGIDHRHPGRSQRRNPRCGGARELLSFRYVSRRGRSHQERGLSTTPLLRVERRTARSARSRRRWFLHGGRSQRIPAAGGIASDS